MHEAVTAYFIGSQCGFKCHSCSLRRYPDYKHILCPRCLDINSRWPPPPKDPPKPEKDPNLIYPGDVDPNFKPARGDILVVNPTIGPSLRKLGFRGSCVVTYDGSPNFPFVRGDVLVRIGGYEVKIVEPPPNAQEKTGKGKQPQAKAPADAKNEKLAQKPGTKAGAKGGAADTKKAMIEAEKPPEPVQALDLAIYKPYEKVEVYYYSGENNEWKFMGKQENLEMKQKVLLETQCPGLTAFYRYYKAGIKVLPKTLAPFLGEIVLPEWLWQEDFDHKANKWRAAGKWYRPDIPDRAELRPGMILLRPLVGQLKAEGSTLLNTVEMNRAKKLEDAKAKELADQKLLEKFLAMEKANAADATAATQDKKGKKSKADEKEDKKKQKADEEDVVSKKKIKNETKEDKKKEGKKVDEKEDKKKGKKGANGEEKEEEVPPQVPPPPNNNEFLKLAKWGAVEMYLFEGNEEGQGWTYYGRSNRICDTAYPLSTEPTVKPKFVSEDDRAQIVEPPPEEKLPEPEPEENNKKGKKGTKKEEEKDKKGVKNDKTKKGDKEEKGGDNGKKPKK